MSELVTRAHLDARMNRLEERLDVLSLRSIVRFGGLLVAGIGALALLQRLAA